MLNQSFVRSFIQYTRLHQNPSHFKLSQNQITSTFERKKKTKYKRTCSSVQHTKDLTPFFPSILISTTFKSSFSFSLTARFFPSSTPTNPTHSALLTTSSLNSTLFSPIPPAKTTPSILLAPPNLRTYAPKKLIIRSMKRLYARVSFGLVEEEEDDFDLEMISPKLDVPVIAFQPDSLLRIFSACPN